jgi:glycine/D-amino acid oxidase-like deaminating enzyme
LTLNFLVIGGGFTGLIAAYALARSGHNVTVVEKDDFVDVSCSIHLPEFLLPFYFIILRRFIIKDV